MAPDGLLYLGGAETVLGITEAFASSPGERGVYERTKQDVGRPLAFAARG
jgi:chemotaxis protein methyltransferase CheR